MALHTNTPPKDVVEMVQKEIDERLEFMRSTVNFASVVKEWLEKHPDELRALYKQYDNKHDYLCRELSWKLNGLLSNVPVKSEQRKKLEATISKLRAEKDTLDPNDPKDTIKASELQTKILKCESNLKSIPEVCIGDLSFKERDLDRLVDAMKRSISEIEVFTEPSDIEARRNAKFEQKMPLTTALYTILYNTRPSTIPISVMSLKAWVYRLKARIEDEKVMENLPGCLFLRSRTDNGRIKGNCGKSTISRGCVWMLERKGLRVNGTGKTQLPTYERVDKDISDQTLIYIDDANFKGVDWETTNKFLDGTPIKNRGKYQREGNIFAFGNILATTNYDLTYENTTRYPQIEFTVNDVRHLLKEPVVANNIEYTTTNGKPDYSDAWETLFALADESWLDDYLDYRDEVVSKCACQKTKIQNLVETFIDEKIVHGATFEAAEVVRWIKERFPMEVKHLNVSSVVYAIEGLGIQQSNKESNDYRKRFNFPTIGATQQQSAIPDAQKVYDWIAANGNDGVANWRW